MQSLPHSLYFFSSAYLQVFLVRTNKHGQLHLSCRLNLSTPFILDIQHTLVTPQFLLQPRSSHHVHSCILCTPVHLKAHSACQSSFRSFVQSGPYNLIGHLYIERFHILESLLFHTPRIQPFIKSLPYRQNILAS